MTLKARITAIDRFIKGCREDGIYDDLNACCVMAGWDSLAGALTPLKGAAPTNNGLSNYDRGIGIAGDGSSAYLDSNRSGDADDNDDNHVAAYVTASAAANGAVMGNGNSVDGLTQTIEDINSGYFLYRNNSASGVSGLSPGTGLAGSSRNSSSVLSVAGGGEFDTLSLASAGNDSSDINVFARRSSNAPQLYWGGTASFYSIGSSLGSDPATGLAALDARVSTLMADLRAIEETGFDRDAIAYIRAVEAADGAYLETDVKVAINNLVAGLKADGLWDAIGASCLLCGPRTLAGALVPLRGDAPTSYGFVEGDFDRLGLQGDGTSYLDSNRANNADPQDSKHLAVYAATATSAFGVYVGSQFDSVIYRSGSPDLLTRINRGTPFTAVAGAAGATGFLAANRPSLGVTQARAAGTTVTENLDAVRYISDNSLIFATVSSGVVTAISDATLAFYSIGSSLDLAKLDSHITDYVTAIGAAI